MPKQQLTSRPTIALTMGDPSGVGPEIILKSISDSDLAHAARWVVVGDSRIFALTREMIGAVPEEIEIRQVNSLESIEDFHFGRIDVRYGQAAIDCVRTATEMCLRGNADAMVTAPINKEAVALRGTPFSGHTEYIAELCGATDSRMLLENKRLCTVHVSTHVPLRKACRLDTSQILRTIELGDEGMKLLGFKQPRIAVCGLNPHAGEHGLFGHEEEQFIVPAITQAQEKGILLSGPHPPDTVFLHASRGTYDLVVAMYHDQGHIAMKLISFEDTVNVTLGVPIIRTSVDHGTAFDIAGKNRADPSNMKQAMRVALRMASTRRSTGR
jgi:4-phospho-D-threonate 3-dehydrogenase / 4-phospho-D-erythronate 3-dehydrogenase